MVSSMMSVVMLLPFFIATLHRSGTRTSLLGQRLNNTLIDPFIRTQTNTIAG
jgi:hypothetical protein